ncbi:MULTISPECIES: 4-hydroxy-tetrahydrodipicolinate reductase [unclassified Pseudoclavibacter]|uniref:4-hydroxy-tetrahydrodipicolinate reductase n=1 Tax=unclassified Pseudoclavibacter TaxID=2615177 RepID=UPI00135C85FF|nr:MULTISPECIES: 4-hydroxy-tetrahydrodipicolinate reductase [unclassified Pseudoclavibacter]MBF4458057.1 4-hydroxy-tetrahydrodipicolinate reductase [Pseudoclavibacter sp. VKM Ac-2867]
METKVAVLGASGRMGTLIARILETTEGLRLHSGLTSASSLDEMLGADVLVDVSRLEASETAVPFALEHGIDVVVGTSGWDEQRIARISDLVPPERAVVFVPNFSLGSVLGTALASVAGRFFESIEIVEAHHDKKVDSPSGTAVRTAERIAASRERPLAAPNSEQDARGLLVSGVPVHSLRLRGVVADQQVIFGGEGEVLTIRHETISQEAYVQGIRLAITHAVETRGTTVGLDGVLGLAGLSGRS